MQQKRKEALRRKTLFKCIINVMTMREGRGGEGRGEERRGTL